MNESGKPLFGPMTLHIRLLTIIRRGCPQDPEAASLALKGIGIDVDPSFFTNLDMVGAFMMERYKNKPEFDRSYFAIDWSGYFVKT